MFALTITFVLFGILASSVTCKRATTQWHSPLLLNATKSDLTAEQEAGVHQFGYDDVNGAGAQQCNDSQSVVLVGSNGTASVATFRAFNFAIDATDAVFAIEVKMRAAIVGNVVIRPARLFIAGIGLVEFRNTTLNTTSLQGGEYTRVIEAPFDGKTVLSNGSFFETSALFGTAGVRGLGPFGATGSLLERSIAAINAPELAVRVGFDGLLTANDSVRFDCVQVRVLYDNALRASDLTLPSDANAENRTLGCDPSQPGSCDGGHVWNNTKDALTCDGRLATFTVDAAHSGNATSLAQLLRFNVSDIEVPANQTDLVRLDMVAIVYSDGVSRRSLLNGAIVNAPAANSTPVVIKPRDLFSSNKHPAYFRQVQSLPVPKGGLAALSQGIDVTLSLAVTVTNATVQPTIVTGIDCVYFILYWTNSTLSPMNMTTTTMTTTSAANMTTSAANMTTSAANMTTTTAANMTTSVANMTTSAANMTTSAVNMTTTAVNMTTPAASVSTSANMTGVTMPANVTTTMTVAGNTSVVSPNSSPDSDDMTGLFIACGVIGVIVIAVAGALLYSRWKKAREAKQFLTI